VPTRSALLRLSQPWLDADLARLYDAFPFEADLPLYLELATAQGGAVLELGCGSGRVLVPLARAGHRVVGVDASPHMLALARDKLARANLGPGERVRLVEGDMRAFDLGETFDLAIIATKSFNYLIQRADQARALAAVAAHLQPGGLLALDLLNPRPDWLGAAPGSLHQDLVEYAPALGATVARTEAVVRTDLVEQVRVTRSAYDIVAADGTVRKRLVEWAYRFIYRFEAEHLLERAGFRVEAALGGYGREPLAADSPTMLFLARR
jgi:SAM-dependent methyltransferase